MDIGIVVLTVIILIDLIVVAGLLYIGSQHDQHHDVQEISTSESVSILTQRAQARAKKLKALEEAFEQGQVSEDSSSE